MSRLGERLLRWSVVVTLPISVVYLYWLWQVSIQFSNFTVRIEAPWFMQMDLHTLGKERFRNMLEEWRLSLTGIFVADSGQEELEKIVLYVNESNIEKLNKRLPASGTEYVKAGILNRGNIENVKIRYRGDFADHWSKDKKSIRVKTNKKNLYKGMRKFNLVIPESDALLNNHFGYALARTMGLVAPESDVVELVLNGKRRGLYILVEQLEELTLRRHNLMPGDLYVGELLAKDGYQGASRRVVEHPGLWKKAAINNHYDENSSAPLKKFMRLVAAKPSEKNSKALGEILDINAWGRFLAFSTLAQTFHYDDFHNWRIYYDPAKGRFIPVVWDADAWSWRDRTKDRYFMDIITSRIHEALFRNTDILVARERILREFFESGKDRDFIAYMDDVISSSELVTKRDPDIPGGDSSNELDKMHKLKMDVKKIFGSVHKAFLESDRKVEYTIKGNGLILGLQGRGVTERLVLNYKNVISDQVNVVVRFYRDGLPVDVDVSGSTTVSGSRIEIKTPLLARYSLQDGLYSYAGRVRTPLEYLFSRTIRLKPAYYELNVNGVGAGNRLVDVLVEDGSASLHEALRVETINVTGFGSQYPVISPSVKNDFVKWSGDIEIDGKVDINKPVLIMPGTRIFMGEAAMLRFHNRVLALGTASKPISVVPKNAGQKPWAAFVLQGRGADNSRLENCNFYGGSGTKTDYYEYSAMFSVHHVEGVKIKHSSFSNNHIVDDMVHAVYSEVDFSDTRFENAKSDAADFDISRVIVEDSRFINSGNDAIDLMSSKAVLLNNYIKNSGDKGVSNGEGSKALIINSTINGNGIGVQSKDGSIATLVNVTLEDNKAALDAYKKNWRYNGGGNIYVYKSRLVGANVSVTADKYSDIYFVDNYISELPDNTEKKQKRVRLVSSNDSIRASSAVSPNLQRIAEEEIANESFANKYWSSVDVTRRGASK